MNREFEQPCLYRARLLTLYVLLVVAVGIGLANLSSELVTLGLVSESIHNQQPVERAYGWPVAWYWRSNSFVSVPTVASSRTW